MPLSETIKDEMEEESPLTKIETALGTEPAVQLHQVTTSKETEVSLKNLK